MKNRRKKIWIVGICLLIGAVGYSQQNEMIKDTLTLSEAVVTGTRNKTDVRHLPMSVSVIKRDQIEMRYEQSLLPLLTEQVPGLFTTGRGIMGYGVSTGAAGGMRMRGIGGSPTAGMLVLIDGHPQYMGLMGHPIADAYQAMLAEKVEVVRGPASVLYGSNAMGGVINILTDKRQEDGWKNTLRLAYGSYNTFTSEANSRFRHKGFSGVISASYNRTDNHRERMGFEQYGGYAKLGYEFPRNWNLFADVNLTHFNASNPGTITLPLIDNDSRITRGMTSFALENNYEYTSGAVNFFYNWGHHNIDDGYNEGATPPDYLFNSKDKMLGINWYQSVILFRGNRVTLGFDYQKFGGEAWNKYTDGRTSGIVDKTEDEIAAYIDFRQSIGHIFTVDAAVRLDHHSKTGTEWIPQIGLSLYPVRTGELKMLVSKGFRNPTIRELYMFRPQNPELLPEKMMNYELSWSQRILEGRFSYGLNVFYIDGDNLIQTVTTGGRPLNVNTGTVENWGLESTVGYRISPAFYASANYSWLRMIYPVPAAPGHKLYVGCNFTRGRWAVSTGIQYINGLYTSTDPIVQEAFVLWDLRGSYRLSRRAGLFVKGENLFAQHYEINAGYPMPPATVVGGINLNF